jgi:hypothetical protein
MMFASKLRAFRSELLLAQIKCLIYWLKACANIEM